MKIAVVGLGKVGLPLAVQFARKGHFVHGVDINADTVASINEGRAPFPGEAHLIEYLSDTVSAGRLKATTDYEMAVPDADTIVVVVPLFVDDAHHPDFGWMDSATEAIGANLTPGALVIYETTLPVGTTRTRWKPALENASGLLEGKDFHIAFSPERVLTGRVFADLRRYPKLIGGLSQEGASRTVAFYEAVLDFEERPDLSRPNGVWDLGSAEAAEMAKLAETTYRDVNIALANQFALFAQSNGIDVLQVIEASNSQPYSHIHRPGIAVGGHCIPVYPRLYLWRDPRAHLVSAAREVNQEMPRWAAELVRRELGGLKGVKVAVLGAAYRGGVKEVAFSGVFPLVAALKEQGAGEVVVQDPLFTDEELATIGLSPYHFGEPVDVVIVQADHHEYGKITPSDLPRVRLVFDGRNILDQSLFGTVRLLTLGKSGDAPPSARRHGGSEQS